MITLPDPLRRLERCPLVIFIAYTIPDDAEARGYAQWLRDVDMPFFNAIPGTLHYANWRITQMLVGEAPVWDWFDFQGLEQEGDLERVWFDPGLDEFRANWLKLWGYGSMKEPPPVLRHSYRMHPAGPPVPAHGARQAVLSGGTGAPPASGPGTGVDMAWRVEGVLHKHFGGRDPSRPWHTPARDFNPLGLDWIAIGWGEGAGPAPGAGYAARAELVAAPDVA